MPWVVLGGVDLRPFTGGAVQPAIAVDPLQVLILAGGFVALAAVSVLVAAAAGRRMSTSSALRMGEE
jgi:putative ABC transport system permease protein